MKLRPSFLFLALTMAAGSSQASGPGVEQMREQHRQLSAELQQLEQQRAEEQRKLEELEALLERSRQLNAEIDQQIQAQLKEAVAESPDNTNRGH